MKVHVDWLFDARKRIQKINKAKLEEIEWYCHGIKVEVSEDETEAWSFIGLNNTDFIENKLEFEGALKFALLEIRK